MNLSEAMAHVLRHQGQSILQGFWKEDLAAILGGVLAEGSSLFRESREKARGFSFTKVPSAIVESAREILEVSRVMPRRIRKGLENFQDDLMKELDQKSDAKEKAIFCLRIMGVLSSSTFGTFYSLRNSGKGLSLGNIKVKSALAKFLVAELVLRSLRLFFLRFLREVEKELTNKDDIDHVRYFQGLMGSESAPVENEIPVDDPAFRITDRLRRTILGEDDEV